MSCTAPTGCKVELKVEMPVDNSFELVCNWCDSSASLEKGLTKYTLKDQFKGVRGEGPAAQPTWTGRCRQLEETARVVEQELAAMLNTNEAAREVEARQSFTTPLKRKRQEATARAREQLLMQKAASDKKRRVSLKVGST